MLLTEEERKEIARQHIIAPNCKLLTKEKIKKWHVSLERLKEKYLNTRTEQILPYEEVLEIAYINGNWNTKWNFTSPVEEVEWRIQQGIYVLVEDEKAVVK